ncbi:MAG: 23S rRNA (pseudouridine(1915)-N(3))-methyltransferase RlmH [Rubrivivax sp.]
MQLLVVAVGQRQPAWADVAWDDFAKRFPPEMRLVLSALKAEPRSSGKSPEQCMAAEAARFDAVLQKQARQGRAARRIVLDEAGSRRSTVQLAERLRIWRDDGRDAVLLVGGPDGLDPALKDTADETLRLSDLTLPHALARVLLAEALYRAATVLQGHPYHRE